MRRALLVAGFAGCLAAPAWAGTWEPDQVELPSPANVLTLASNGRGAAVGDDGSLHVAVQAQPNETDSRVYYLRRDPSGAWSDPEPVSLDSQARGSALAVGQKGDIHVVWQGTTSSQGAILYRHRDADGTWGPVESLNLPHGLSYEPVIAADPFGRPHAVWLQQFDSRPQVLYSRRDDAWSAPQVVSVDGGAPADPTLVADGAGDIHVAWSDRVGQPSNFGVYNYEIFYARLHPEPGAEFEIARLTTDLAISRDPFLEATDDGTVHVVWLDNRADVAGGIFEVFYKRRLPGLGWGKDKRFTYDGSGHGRPVLAAGADHTVNVVWEDYRHGSPDLYYRQITWEYGWDVQPTRLTADLSPSQRPSLVTLPNGSMVLLWTDARDSHNMRVFAKNGHVRAPDGVN